MRHPDAHLGLRSQLKSPSGLLPGLSRGNVGLVQIKEPDSHPALSGDEVYTPSPRRSEG